MKTPYDLNTDAVKESGYFIAINWYIQIIYQSFYMFFSMYFLNMHIHHQGVYKRMRKLAIGLAISGSLVFIASLISGYYNIVSQYFIFIHLPLLLYYATVTIYTYTSSRHILKYIFIYGVVVYMTCGFIALYFSIFRIDAIPYPIIFFYIGILLDLAIFSYGLGVRLLSSLEKRLQVEKELAATNIKLKKQLEASLVIQQEKNKLLKELNASQVLRTEKVEMEKEIAELNTLALRNQMNSHFIFNMLNSIKAYIIRDEKENAIKILNKFAKLIRRILQISKKEATTLDQELETLKIYFTLENIRFNKEIEYLTEIEEGIDVSKIKFPTLILQPFIENAIWHGLISKEGHKKIKIAVYKKAESLLIDITDNGIGRKAAKARVTPQDKTSMGMSIVKQKIHQFNIAHDTAYRYEVIDLEEGTTVRISTQLASAVNAEKSIA